jgi:hypothetical protein
MAGYWRALPHGAPEPPEGTIVRTLPPRPSVWTIWVRVPDVLDDRRWWTLAEPMADASWSMVRPASEPERLVDVWEIETELSAVMDSTAPREPTPLEIRASALDAAVRAVPPYVDLGETTDRDPAAVAELLARRYLVMARVFEREYLAPGDRLRREFFRDPQDVTALDTDPADQSDGFHTFRELYDHRRALTLALCNAVGDLAWRSKLHDDGTMLDGMFIVGIDLPGAGQISYHYELEHWDQFAGVREWDRAPRFDGHTPADVVRRLIDWAGA